MKLPTDDPVNPAATGQAIYKQIEADILRRVNRGEWRPGAMLPSRRDLARHYGVSPLTVERAVTCLVASGVLRTDDRRGTFVVDTRPAPAVEHSPSLPPVAGRKAAVVGIVGSLYLMSQDHLELNNHWVRILVESIEQACARNGDESRFFNRVTPESAEPAPLADTISAARKSGVDAIAVIGIGVPIADFEQTIASVDDTAIPMVCVSSSPLQRPAPNVSYDNYGAGYQAAQHLIDIGRRRIVVFAPQDAGWARERIQGIRKAAEDAGAPGADVALIPADPPPWRQDIDPETHAYGVARAFLAGAPPPETVICIQDQGAFGYMKAAREVGAEAGRDYAIAAFDDHARSRDLQLTSMRPPMEAMGREASLLIRRALNGENASAHICLRWNLIVRRSTTQAPLASK